MSMWILMLPVDMLLYSRLFFYINISYYVHDEG